MIIPVVVFFTCLFSIVSAVVGVNMDARKDIYSDLAPKDIIDWNGSDKVLTKWLAANYDDEPEEVLRIGIGAPLKERKNRHQMLSRLWHPDKNMQLIADYPESKKWLEAVMDKLNKAKSKLNVELRKEEEEQAKMAAEVAAREAAREAEERARVQRIANYHAQLAAARRARENYDRIEQARMQANADAASERKHQEKVEDSEEEKSNREKLQRMEKEAEEQRLLESTRRLEMLKRIREYDSDPTEDTIYEKTFVMDGAKNAAIAIRQQVLNFNDKVALTVLFDNEFDAESRNNLLNINWWTNADANAVWALVMEQYFALFDSSLHFVSPRTFLKQAVASCSFQLAEKLVAYFGLSRPVWSVWRNALFICPEIVPKLLELEKGWSEEMKWRTVFDMSYMLEIYSGNFSGNLDSTHTSIVLKQILELGARPAQVRTAMILAAKMQNRELFDLMVQCGGDRDFDNFFLARNRDLIANLWLRRELVGRYTDYLNELERQRRQAEAEEKRAKMKAQVQATLDGVANGATKLFKGLTDGPDLVNVRTHYRL